MLVDRSKIEFLGMKPFNGQYEARPHIAQELLKFPNKSLIKVQMMDQIPESPPFSIHIKREIHSGPLYSLTQWSPTIPGNSQLLKRFCFKHIQVNNPLSRMLKKNPSAWNKL